MPGAAPSPPAQPTTWATAASPANSSSSSSSIEVRGLCRRKFNIPAGYKPACAGDDGPACRAAAAAEGIKSTLTNQETVRGLCRKFNIPAGYKPACAGDDGRACRAPPGSICVYEDALDAGMRVPLHPFYSKALQHYGLAPSQLTPNAWRYMAAFVVLCSDVGVKARLSVFRHFFTVCIYMNKDREGWHFFKPHKVSEHDRRCCLFRTTSWQLPKNDGWKEKFSFLSSPAAAWPCPVKWGKPSREAVCNPKLSEKARGDIQKLYDVQGSACIDLMSLLAEDKLATALTPATSVKMEENGGTAAARTGLATPNGKSPVVAQSLPTPPGDSITRDQLLASVERVDGDDWLQTVLKKTADVVQKESSLLRQELGEARESEAAAKAELAEARKSETAAKAELGKARKSEAAAKADLGNARKSEAAAKAELGKARKSEVAAKAELAKARKSEGPAKAELITTKAELITTKAELDEMRKSEAATKAMLASAKAKIQKTGNEHFEDFVRLHNIMMEGLGSAFGTVNSNAAPTVNQTVLSRALGIQNQDITRAHEESHAQSTRL